MLFRNEDSYFVEILDKQDFFRVDPEKIQLLCSRILDDFHVRTGKIGIVLVDGDTIRQYNRDYLKHDYATDVISFPIESLLDEGHLEAEILVCTEVARDRAPEFGWSEESELLLYIVHGLLHAVELDDTTPEAREKMRQNERKYLGCLGIDVPDWDFSEWDDDE